MAMFDFTILSKIQLCLSLFYLFYLLFCLSQVLACLWLVNQQDENHIACAGRDVYAQC